LGSQNVYNQYFKNFYPKLEDIQRKVAHEIYSYVYILLLQKDYYGLYNL